MPSASESYGRLADEMWVEVKIFKIPYGLNYSDFYYVYYQCNVIVASEMHFGWLFSSIAF